MTAAEIRNKRTVEKGLPYPPQQPVRFAIFVGAINFLVWMLTRLRIEGTGNMPGDGAYVFVSNHLHYLDTPVLGPRLPAHTHALAAEKYERHIFGVLLRAAGCIFINRGEVDRSALRMALNVLQDGKKVMVAVEGTRSKSGELAEGRPGASYIAARSQVPIIPVALWGTEQIIPAWKKLRRAEVTIRFGRPIAPPEPRARTEQLEAHTEQVMLALAALLPEQYRGMWGDDPRLAETIRVQRPEVTGQL